MICLIFNNKYMEKIELLKIIEEVYSKDCRLDGVEWLDEDLANILLEKFEQELDKAREEGRKEYLKEVELMERFSSRKEIDLTRDEAFKRLVRLLKSKLKQ